MAETWRERINIRTPDVDNNILSLSGGNQQKALFARALGSDAGIVLMDDPMRGVDIGTKQEVYAMIRAEAEGGRTFVWYTTEMDELRNCDHVYVFRNGRIVADLARHELTEEKVLHSSFAEERRRERAMLASYRPRLLRAHPAGPVAARSCSRRSSTCNPRTMSYVGLNLMLNLAIPIALATIAQMCVITVNDLDLSIGAYVGFVVCVAGDLAARDAGRSASLLLAGGILVYAAVGALIHLRNLPSIVVTLGMSFVWLGLAVLVLPTPGGKSPEWLAWLMKLKPPYVPFPIIAAAGHRRRRHVRADAHLLRLDPARLRRQSEGDRARRLVAAEDQGDDVRARRLLRHARRPLR